MGQSGTQNKFHCPELAFVRSFSLHCFPNLLPGDQGIKIETGVLWKMTCIVRAALRSNCSSSVCAFVQRSLGHPVRCFSTEAEQPPLNSTTPPPFFDVEHSGVTYGRLFGIRKHVLKTDIINFLEGCNLTLEDVKLDYNRSLIPVSTLLQFPSRSSYDNAIRVIVRNGRLYKLDRADRSQWDIVKPYDGKTILIQGMPRAATYEDLVRTLSGCEYDSSSVNLFLRPGEGGTAEPIKLATVRFHSRTQAMNAYIAKNGTFCQNSRISIQVLQ
ncbi:uncharacterized protein LOC114182701 isoform X2 [Vigna unguiculata]|uniref:Uncharacterized protein n=1 Tax=Vigna unguiculata TaxID=3917 RepID=A0A4D6LXY3_VIGUN|nr:uncharacterized protein LOC114182701 isoform X2 [Vigna unguiculata]QCD92744.1 hypothetical protein DEO72_LG5g813 [Vigna unguiculata]